MTLTLSRACSAALSVSTVAGLLLALHAPAAACSQPPTPASLAASAEAFVGPSAADMRPGQRPLDLAAHPVPPGAERAWLAKDVDMIWRVRSILPPTPSASAFFHALDARDTQKDTDLGFGLHLQTARVAGGYTTCFFTLVSQADAIVSLRAECTAQTPADEGIGPTLAEALGQGFSLQPGSSLVARAEYQSPAASADARAALDRALGAQAPVLADSLPRSVREAYERLMSPLEELAVGSSCGIVGRSPAGRDAMLTLIAAKRIDLLRNVLRGPNPGGRIYAAQALRQLRAMSPQDEAIVAALASSSTPVTLCNGCMFSEKTSADALQVKAH